MGPATFPRLNYWPASANYFLGPNARSTRARLDSHPIPPALRGDLPGTAAYPDVGCPPDAGQAPQMVPVNTSRLAFLDSGDAPIPFLMGSPGRYITRTRPSGPRFSRVLGYDAGANGWGTPAPTSATRGGVAMTARGGMSRPAALAPSGTVVTTVAETVEEPPPPTTIPDEPPASKPAKAFPWGWVLGGGALVLLVAGGIYLATRPPRRSNPTRRRRRRRRARARARRRRNPVYVEVHESGPAPRRRRRRNAAAPRPRRRRRAKPKVRRTKNASSSTRRRRPRARSAKRTPRRDPRTGKFLKRSNPRKHKGSPRCQKCGRAHSTREHWSHKYPPGNRKSYRRKRKLTR